MKYVEFYFLKELRGRIVLKDRNVSFANMIEQLIAGLKEGVLILC
ncbi:MAG: hypothetical protein U9R43_15530 [Thermodesulfobacteriota bacterium]|nr:hypothetical protein [Thermodesulfobacteriota bacterium]